MNQVMEIIQVDVPVDVAYNQWTQFEEFPRFMEGVEEVRQLDDTHLHWVASIAGVRREWDAEIVEQVPDQVVSWVNIDGVTNRGTVRFDPVAPQSTRVTLALDFEPEGLIESVGDKLGFVKGRARADLERFREFITSRGVETGGWRGEVHDGMREDSGGMDAGTGMGDTGMGGTGMGGTMGSGTLGGGTGMGATGADPDFGYDDEDRYM